ncbi:hypothetical protein HanPSC8_Chr12g0505421 [Helianthus annuus]|nr:hypothetical protein HanPSC8_Chr12g0505421 [Helianthus annuus]
MSTVISTTSFTDPSRSRSYRSLENILELLKCISLPVEIRWIEYLFNKMLIKLPGPRLYMWCVIMSTVSGVLAMNSLNQLASKKPPGAIIRGLGSTPE